MDRKTKTYKGEKAYKRGIEHMMRQGWTVASSVTHQPRSGILRIIMLGGIGALIWKPKERYIVTFQRVA